MPNNEMLNLEANGHLDVSHRVTSIVNRTTQKLRFTFFKGELTIEVIEDG